METRMVGLGEKRDVDGSGRREILPLRSPEIEVVGRRRPGRRRRVSEQEDGGRGRGNSGDRARIDRRRGARPAPVTDEK